MSDQHHDDTVMITLDLPAHLAAQLEEFRKEFGEELVVDLLRKANAAVEGKLALRGGLLHKRRT
jgi:hypothetical protein